MTTISCTPLKLRHFHTTTTMSALILLLLGCVPALWAAQRTPDDVYAITPPSNPARHITLREVYDLVQRRAGIKSPFTPISLPNSMTTTTAVYNKLQLILTEIRGLKLHLKVIVFPAPLSRVHGKNFSDVEQNLKQSIFLLQQILGIAASGEALG